jgi:hypothetical protein
MVWLCVSTIEAVEGHFPFVILDLRLAIARNIGTFMQSVNREIAFLCAGGAEGRFRDLLTEPRA